MTKGMKKAVAFGLVAAMAAGLLAGCGASGESAPAGSAPAEQTTTEVAPGVDGTLRFGCQNYSDGLLDPAAQTNCAWNLMRYGIGESLFKFNDAMEAEPWLAESVEVSEDHKTWTIKIKDDLKFSNGNPCNASAVKASLDRVREEGPNGSSAPETFLETAAVITADDETNTIVIETETAYVNLPGNLAHPVMEIVDVEGTTDWNNGVIGTGPYMVESFQDQVGYNLVANPNYREDVPYERVELLYMGDASAKAMALKNGQVDLVENITNVADIQDFMNDTSFTVDIGPGVRTGFSWINHNGILADDVLRKAVLMGIDDEAICTSNLIGGLYTPGFSVLPSNLNYGYDNLENGTPFDAEAAMAMLDEAGYVDTDGDGIREKDGQNIVLKYVYYDNRLLKEFAQAHHQYLTQIGIEVEEVEGSSDDQWSSLVAGDYDLNGNNWTTVATGDPTDFLANWCSTAEANYCGYSNAEYDALYEELVQCQDADRRVELIEGMQQILAEDGAVLIDGYYNSSMIYSKNVGYAHIHTADYYWLSTEITPAE